MNVLIRIHYPRPLHLQKAYGFLDLKEGSYPVSERVAERVLSLPNYPEMSDEGGGVWWRKLRSFCQPCEDSDSQRLHSCFHECEQSS